MGTEFKWSTRYIIQLILKQIGDGTAAVALVPKIIYIGATIIDISAGQTNTFALANNNTVYAWGQDNYGQIGFCI